MRDYETRPIDRHIKRMKQSRKKYLRWYDSSKDSLPKNIIKNVLTVQKIYDYKGNLYI